MLDRSYPVALKQLRKDPLHHAPVGQHVRHAAWHAQIVFQYHELTPGQADQIRPDNRDIHVARDLQSAHLTAKLFAAIDDLARNNAIGENAAFVVDVAQKKIQRGNALRKTAFDVIPLGARHDARQQIIWENSLRSLFAPVNGEGDSLVQE